MAQFTHLHVHTQYSLLDGASKVPLLIEKAKKSGMKALAITDHGNMFGVKSFYNEAKKQGIKPIIGCEIYVARRTRHDKDDKVDRGGEHLILLAKNKTGYHNLVRIVSTGWIDGFYYNPRVDKEILRKYSQGLIASSACLGGEVPQAIMRSGAERASKVIEEFKEIYGDDFYLEIMDHGLPEQKQVNQALVELAEQHHVKLIATNDVHFINAEDAEAHDILVCLSTSKDYDDPNRMRYTGQEFLRTPQEMQQVFPDLPQALENTNEVAEKVEVYKLDRDILLPEFPLPEGFSTQDDYLRHLTYEGAERIYHEISDQVKERLDHELHIIQDMGFSGYFLIVQDFIQAAKKNGVSVGPGRGSAAGSAVAFCTGITNVDPIKYNLLFERFLNPERVTMPDIDIDFDDDGRDNVLNWVVEKYGKDRVAHIITFGSMAAKSAIRDVARVLKLPLPESNRLAKLVPEGPKVKLSKAYNEVPELAAEKEGSANPLITKTLKFAEILEGSVRQIGLHACGVIIGPEDLIEHIPLSTNKDTDLLVTQYDGKHVEDVGMLKMDFLGLKTLSIIKDAIENVKHSKGIEIDPDKIPLDDPKTFELYQRGETVGTFQFESEGMRQYLRQLKPTNLEDLFAMNALYRPGPMGYIPTFINRKHGREKVEYPHPMLEEILKDTYGIMVYQEQIMQTAQKMGGFTLGGADLLRRAMGKKKMEIMEQQKVVFIEGAKKKGISEEKAKEVFGVMEKFAAYGFNRSHSAAYSLVAFQTGYLKANYPGEYMSAVLSRNLNDITKITTFMDESRRMGLPVLGPDVNESFVKFTVNKQGAIRFGLAAIKGVGEAACKEIIREREENGLYKDIYDFVERVNLRTVNRRNMEALAMAGAFDQFPEIQRYQFFSPDDNETAFSETLIKYGARVQYEKSNDQQSLFGQKAEDTVVHKPQVPDCPAWSRMKTLSQEKEYIGIYLSAHPLDDFKLAIDSFANTELSQFGNMAALNGGKEIKVAGMVTEVQHRTDKKGRPFGSISIEDYTDTHRFMLFNRDYSNYREFMQEGTAVLITGKVKESYYGKRDQFEFQISKMDYLAEMTERFKSLALKVKIEQLDDNFIQEIRKLAEENKGNVMLKFLIYEPETKVWVQMFSRTHKVDVSEKLIDYIENTAQLEYKLE